MSLLQEVYTVKGGETMKSKSKLVKKRVYYVMRTSVLLEWSKDDIAAIKKAELILKKQGLTFMLTEA